MSRADWRIWLTTFALCLAAFFGAGATGHATDVAVRPDPWPLWTGPTKLRGANIYQRRITPDDGFGEGPVGPPYLAGDLPKLAEWGANYVNISHAGTWNEVGPTFQRDQAVFNHLLSLVDAAGDAGLYAVVSLRTGPGRIENLFIDPEHTPPSPVWTSAAAQAAWPKMWRDLAVALRNRLNVAGYDLMVEPETDDVATWNRMAGEITDAIREVDAVTPILRGGAPWGGADALESIEPTGDARTVYTVHQYEPFKYTHQSSKKHLAYKKGLAPVFDVIQQFAARQAQPIAVNEFGVKRWAPKAHKFLNEELNRIEALGANHAVWIWESSSPLVTYRDFDFRRGPKPKSKKEVAASKLIDVIKANWAKNTVRPNEDPA
jgi:hypothetical protein